MGQNNEIEDLLNTAYEKAAIARANAIETQLQALGINKENVKDFVVDIEVIAP